MIKSYLDLSGLSVFHNLIISPVIDSTNYESVKVAPSIKALIDYLTVGDNSIGATIDVIQNDISDIKYNIQNIDQTSITSIEQTKTSTESGGINEVTITQKNQTKSLFQIRNGEKGDPSVYYGTNEPTDNNINIWIDPSDDNDWLKTVMPILMPIGYVITNTKESFNPNTDPNYSWATWKLITDKFLIGAGNSYPLGATGGEATHKLTLDEIPSHAHSRGTMNITGSFQVDPDNGWCRIIPSGAFVGAGIISKSAIGGGIGSRDVETKANFDASRTWSGETSYQGLDIAHNNLPPYQSVYYWERIA